MGTERGTGADLNNIYYTIHRYWERLDGRGGHTNPRIRTTTGAAAAHELDVTSTWQPTNLVAGLMRGPTYSRKWCSSLVRCGGGEGMIRRRIIGGTGRTGDQGIDKSKSPHQVRNRGTGAKNGSQERGPRSESGSHVLHGFWLTLAGRRSGHGCLKASPRVEVHQAWGAWCMARGTIQWVWGHRSSGSGGDSNPTLSMLRDSSTC